jgi:protein-S-isoprenylcysteine O-methyltransferase Ste14
MSGGPRYLFPKRYSDFVQRFRVAGGFLLLVVFTWLPEPTRESLVTGLPVAVAGLFLRGWAAGHLAKNQQLAMSGPYAYMRNPLYAGTVIAALGMVIAARSICLAILFALVFLLVYLPAIELEEQHLREIFPEYAAYAQRIRRFLPIAKWQGPMARFSWKLYSRNEEYKAAAGFLVAAAWLVIRFRS